MKMASKLKILMLIRLLVFLVFIPLFFGCNEKKVSSHHNVVLITIDALRPDYLSLSGSPSSISPTVDKISREGITFTRAITAFQGTTPSMPALMTGLFPNFEKIKSWNRKTWYGFSEYYNSPDEIGLPDEVRSIAEVLQANGYQTAGFNTNPHLTKKFNFHQGFDHYDDFEDYFKKARALSDHLMKSANPPAEVVINHVVKWLETHKDKPFFIWLHLMDTHTPYLPPEPFKRMFPNHYTDFSDIQVNEAFHRIMVGQFGGKSPEDYASLRTLGLAKEEWIEHIKALYKGGIAYADREIGRLCQMLKKESIWSRTLFIITADHGEEFLEHGHVSHHLLTPGPEELIRVPLIMHIPGLPAKRWGQKISKLIRLVDIAPTILDYAGFLGKNSSMNGVSLRPFIEGTDAPQLTAFISAIKFGIARNEEWKYRLIKKSFSGLKDVEMLFRIQDDPLEKEDVASKYPKVLEKMRKEYRAFAEQLQIRAPSGSLMEEGEAQPKIDEETRNRLKVLGYME